MKLKNITQAYTGIKRSAGSICFLSHLPGWQIADNKYKYNFANKNW